MKSLSFFFPLRLSLLLVGSFVLCRFAFAAAAEYDWNAPLPPASQVRIGKLDNGLTYYIRENKKPQGRVELRLVVNAGSLQETDSQRGLAHFVEHMAFNGTKRFSGHEIEDFLESNGMRFGSHLNASTSFNETIYKLHVPVEDPAVLEKAFWILEDWAGGILFDETEIDKERGVIVEEWRSRKGAGMRIAEKQYPFIYYGSKYPERLPIGQMEIVESAPREEFLKFYRDWYRPELMAVIVVGDIETSAIEERIKQGFSSLENPAGAPERVANPIPGHEETLVSIEVDPELTQAGLRILLKTDHPCDDTAADYRLHWIERMYFSMVGARIHERTQRENPPFQGAGLSGGWLAREKFRYSMNIGFLGDRYAEGVRGLLAEIDRVQRDGFSEGEFQRAKTNLLRSMQRAYDERDKQDSASYLRELTEHFLTGETIPGIELEFELLKRILEEVTLEDVEAVSVRFEQKDNRVILFSGPDKDGFHVPTEAELLAALVLGDADRLPPYEDGVGDEPLIPELPQAGSVVSELYHESIDTYEWSLSNGVRVFVKATDFKNDQILMNAYSPGGLGLVMDDEYATASVADTVVGQSGLGSYDAIQLGKRLAGKVASVGAGITGIEETLSGSASPKDLETFFQLLHLKFTGARLDEEAFSSLQTRFLAMIENRLKNPNAVFGDAITRALYGDHPRHQPVSPEIIQDLDPELALLAYQDRFADASDFTFAFVGAIELEPFRDLVERYLATLPALGRVEEARFAGDSKAEGRLEVTVERNLENKASVQVMMHGPAEWTPENVLACSFARDVLNLRFREVLREENSGVYGARVSASLSRLPLEAFSSGFSFTCDPANADTLIALAQGEIRKLQAEGPSEKDLAKVREMSLKSLEKGQRENGFWLGRILHYHKTGRPFDDVAQSAERIRAVGAEDVRRAAQLYFDDTNLLIAKLNPQPAPAVP